MTERIEVRYKLIAGTSAYHKYIIYTDSNGDKWIARGGPENGDGYDDRGGDDYSLPGSFGKLVTEIKPYINHPDTPDRVPPGGDPDPSEVIAEDADLSGYWADIVEAMNDLDDFPYQYQPMGQNSNAAVDDALERAGLPPATLDDTLWSPGSDVPFEIFFPDPLLKLLPSWVADILDLFDDAKSIVSPLIVDLDADGVEATAFNAATTTTFFDLNSDGFAEQTAWVGAHDGLLVRDVNENGTIDNGSELFGSPTIDGFALLQQLDSNGDLVIDQYDEAWNELLIWKDTNSDAISQESELETLSYHTITSINLAGVAASGSTVNGNPISHTSTVTKNGSSAAIADVWFVHDHMNTAYQGNVELDPRVLFLPTLRGFGQLPDLHVAMSQNEDLLDLVETFAIGWSFDSLADNELLNGAIDDILYEWAGVESVSPTSRGSSIDARHLEFLEKYVGEEFKQQSGGQPNQSNPQGQAAFVLEASWSAAHQNLKSHLLLQTEFKELFSDEITYNVWTGEIEGNLDLDQNAIDALVPYATAPGVDAEDYWLAVADALHALKDLYYLTVDEETWLDDAVQESDGDLTWDEIEAAYYALTQDPSGQTITGTTNTDTLTGTVYDDVVNGLAGHDTIEGREGDDVLNGGDGNDTIEGQEGNDELYGDAGNDILKPGEGGNFVYGHTGDDEYVYAGGDDVYTDYSGADKITLPSGIAFGDLTFWRSANDLHIGIDGGGSIQILSQFPSSGWVYALAIEKLVFADTSEYNLSTLTSFATYGTDAAETITGIALITVNETIYGLGGNDTLDGNDGNDVLDGGLGNDTLFGDGGDDTYVFSPGFDLILEGGGTDTVLIPVGYDASDLTFFRSTSAENSLTLTVTGLGQMQNAYQFHWNSSFAFEYIAFASGGSPVAMSAYSIETIGTSGNNTLNGVTSGASTNDILNGMGGNDTLYGDAGNDTYIFSEGDDIAYDTAGTETLKFRGDYLLEDIVLYRMNGGGGGQPANELMIEDAFGNSIRFSDHFNASAASPMTTALEQLVFSDNSTVSVYSLEIETRGTSGADQLYEVLYGDASNVDTIYAFGGADQVNGGAGNDFIDGGDGIDILDGGNDNDIIYGGSGNDTLMGGASDNGNDTLYGDAGDDGSWGYGGDDTYVYSAGLDGVTDSGGTDTLLITGGLTINDMSIANHGSDEAKITISSGTNEIIVNNLRHGTASNHVDFIAFDDGFRTTLPDYASWLNGTSGNDTSTGNGNANTQIGYAGNDTMDGLGGNDAIHGGSGNDSIEGGDGTDLLHGGVGDDSLYGEDGLDTLYGGSGTDTFVFQVASAFNNIDVVKDYSIAQSDKLDINDIVSFDPMNDDIADFLSFTNSGANSQMFVDRDGTGGSYSSVQVALIEGVTDLDAEDLLNGGYLIAA